MSRTRDYYDSANYAGDDLLDGTGVIGLIAGDQLHPPMIDDPAIWCDSGRWREGAAASVRRLLARAALRPGDLALDVGCGVGGVTRMLRREFGARSVGVNISARQLRTAVTLSAAEYYVLADAECLPVGASVADCVITINMFYHVADKRAALHEMFRVTRPGGKLAFDDWVVTDRATEADRARLLQHWNPEPVPWITDRQLEQLLQAAGYRVERIDDYADVGRTVMAHYFGQTFEAEVRPMIVRHDPLHGDLVADHLRCAIDHTIELYREHKLRYLQIVAARP